MIAETKFDRVRKSVLALLEEAGVARGVRVLLTFRGIEMNVKHPPATGPVSSGDLVARMSRIAAANRLRLTTDAGVSFLMYPPSRPPVMDESPMTLKATTKARTRKKK